MAFWGHRDAAACPATEAPVQDSEEDELEERMVFHKEPQRWLPRKNVPQPAVGAKRKLNFKSTKRGTGKQVRSVNQKATLDNRNYRTNGETRKQLQQNNDFLTEAGITLTQQRAADQPPRIRAAKEMETEPLDDPSLNLSQDSLYQALLNGRFRKTVPLVTRLITERRNRKLVLVGKMKHNFKT
jgi:hypothetical protein